jgi:antitoxin VapB
MHSAIFVYIERNMPMPLYIRDSVVDALAAKVQEALKVPTKTEAVRLALQHELQRAQEAQPALLRAAKAIAMYEALRKKARARGRRRGRDDFDMKAFTDEMWGEA